MVVPDTAHGLTKEIPRWRLQDFGPWWWLPTTDALAAMCRVVGFEVLGLELTWSGYAATLLLQVAG